MSKGLKVGRQYRLRADALSNLEFSPGEVLTYLGRDNPLPSKEDPGAVYHQFRKSDGSAWKWSRTTGELLDGWLEIIGAP